MNPLKLVTLLALAVAAGVCVLYCVTKVGDLNGLAATPGLSAAKIANLHSEARTIGSLGWCAFIFVGVDVVSGLISYLTKP